MRKKRYDEGGDVEVDSTTTEESTPEPRMGSGMKEKVEPAGTFKEAFAAARKSGQKMFTFNGKKYNTNLASDKSKPSDYGSFQARDKAEGSKQADRESKITQAQGMGSEYSKMSSALKKAPPGAGRDALEKLTSQKKSDYEIATAAIPKMAKGGKVKKMASGGCYAGGGSVSRRADGIAQRGKTNCKMV